MVESADHSGSRPFAASLRVRRLLWYLLVLCWAAIGLWVLCALRGCTGPRYPWPDAYPEGSYHTVEEVLGPVTLRLSGLGVVRLAGVAEPQEPADRRRATTFLKERLPAGTTVYVELEPRPKREPDAPIPVSVYLPPSDDDRAAPFPYADARLVAEVLVQQGLARVDTGRLYRYRAELEFQEDDARRHGRGLWSILHPPL